MVHDDFVPRQIFAASTTTRTTVAAQTLASTAHSEDQSALCTVALPAGGILRFNESFPLLLEDTITFESSCDDQAIHGCPSVNGNSTVVKFDDPFYASVAPQIYALATATIISYILVILIFITPRTFYVGGPGAGAGFTGIRSIVPGSGSSSVIGIGRRPLLQKIAAVTVAISLTIASADTFHVAERQYNDGLMDSQSLVRDVIGSVEIRVVRVVSDTFLWLAQVQTLIRLFPRHKEKVTIKWLGFALVTCDTIFSILENFVSENTLTSPRSFKDAIPALSYLFQMAISLIYASCVIYYSLSKRRFAFWHSKMRNILLVASLSLASVLIPVVFFVLDVSQPSIATWGEYIRWVGAAAASVVVWEWVERIEALERDERKDGILGREIFDGDEMIDFGSENKGNGNSMYFGFAKRTGSNERKKVSMMPVSSLRPRLPFRRRKKHDKQDRQGNDHDGSGNNDDHDGHGAITRPVQAVTPSRSDTASAASTVYAVRYQNMSSPSPAIPEEPAILSTARPSIHLDGRSKHLDEAGDPASTTNMINGTCVSDIEHDPSDRHDARNRQMWQAVANPFKRKRAEPPAEVAAQMAASNVRRSPAQTYHNLRGRLNAFKSSQRGNGKKRAGPSPPMPVTIIPAQPRLSRAVVPGNTPRTASIQPEVPQQEPEQRSSRSRNSRISTHRGSMPVTVIPAPVRGGRTWSPDDVSTKNASAPTRMVLNENGPGVVENASSLPQQQHGDDVYITRGMLTIAESPLRAREHDSGGSPTTRRCGARLGAPTIDTLNDRLSSVSSGSAGANSTESGSDEHRSQSPTTDVSSERAASAEIEGSRNASDSLSNQNERVQQ